MLCDANGTPLRFRLSGGQASDISYAQPLLDKVSIPSSQRGRPRNRCKWLLADKGYDAEALRRYCDQYRMQPVIPLRSYQDCLIGPSTDSTGTTKLGQCILVQGSSKPNSANAWRSFGCSLFTAQMSMCRGRELAT